MQLLYVRPSGRNRTCGKDLNLQPCVCDSSAGALTNCDTESSCRALTASSWIIYICVRFSFSFHSPAFKKRKTGADTQARRIRERRFISCKPCDCDISCHGPLSSKNREELPWTTLLKEQMRVAMGSILQ